MYDKDENVNKNRELEKGMRNIVFFSVFLFRTCNFMTMTFTTLIVTCL